MAEVASKVQQLAPQDWLWYGRHVKLVDGFTVTMSDTPENQEAFGGDCIAGGAFARGPGRTAGTETTPPPVPADG